MSNHLNLLRVRAALTARLDHYRSLARYVRLPPDALAEVTEALNELPRVEALIAQEEETCMNGR